MFALRGRKDHFRFNLPNDFIVDEINDKYAAILQEQHSFIYKPIDFLNETIVKLEVFGFSEATIAQQQTATGIQLRNVIGKNGIPQDRSKQNAFFHAGTEVNYRSEANPIQLIDKTLNVTFRHTLGFINYFLMFENFFYLYSRDTSSEESKNVFTIDFLDGYGRAYAKVVLMDPVIHSIDMLSLDYTQPVAQSDTFQVVFKYSNLDYQFINVDNNEKTIFETY